jgi:hypothetical protein
MGNRLAELTTAYRATEYRFRGDDHEGVVRIGERCLWLEALLQRASMTTWAYITACNPNSIELSDMDNAARMGELRSEVQQLKLPYLPGKAIDPTAKWPAEPSLLILGISLDDAVKLGRRFGQLALVAGELGEPACLTWTDGTKE